MLESARAEGSRRHGGGARNRYFFAAVGILYGGHGIRSVGSWTYRDIVEAVVVSNGCAIAQCE